MKKYAYPVFSRDDTVFETKSQEPSWYNDFVSNLDGNAKKTNASVYDEINAILNNVKPKYSTVEEAVVDMQKRTGLIEYLNRKEAQAMAEKQRSDIPQTLKDIPELKIFIDNFIQERPGIAVEAVADAAVKINSIKNKLPNRNDVGDDVRKYISDKITEHKKLYQINEDVNLNLGKADFKEDKTVVDDPLGLLEPSVLK